jgi:hypothetical protein
MSHETGSFVTAAACSILACSGVFFGTAAVNAFRAAIYMGRASLPSPYLLELVSIKVNEAIVLLLAKIIS